MSSVESDYKKISFVRSNYRKHILVESWVGDNMKVDKYRMLKNDMYEITFEGHRYIVHSDLILKSKLLLRDDVTKETLEKLVFENQVYEAYNIALRQLNTKVRCYKELHDTLTKRGYNGGKIKEALDILIKQGYLSDRDYAKYYVHDQIALTNNGPWKIRKKLEENEIADKYIDEALQVFTEDIQKEKVKKLIAQLVKTNRTKSTYALKQKAIVYLINLGYSKEIINPFIVRIDFDDEKIFRRELAKLKRTLSKKYQGEELQRRIRQKLYAKGFNVSNLKEEDFVE